VSQGYGNYINSNDSNVRTYRETIGAEIPSRYSHPRKYLEILSVNKNYN
jgi:uncharacterized Zn-finger protein